MLFDFIMDFSHSSGPLLVGELRFVAENALEPLASLLAKSLQLLIF